jgi:transcriptional regulator with XRE-family HTH domain
VQRLHNVEHRGIFPVPRAKKNKQAGAAFKELLEQKGFSNYKLAKAIGMGTGHIGRIASGEIASPTPATLEKIAAALGVELGELTKIFAQLPMRSHSAELPQPQEQEQEETPSKNTDFVGREEAIANSTLKNNLDTLLEKARLLQVSPDSIEQAKQAVEGIPSVLQEIEARQYKRLRLQEKAKKEKLDWIENEKLKSLEKDLTPQEKTRFLSRMQE